MYVYLIHRLWIIASVLHHIVLYVLFLCMAFMSSIRNILDFICWYFGLPRSKLQPRLVYLSLISLRDRKNLIILAFTIPHVDALMLIINWLLLWQQAWRNYGLVKTHLHTYCSEFAHMYKITFFHTYHYHICKCKLIMPKPLCINNNSWIFKHHTYLNNLIRQHSTLAIHLLVLATKFITFKQKLSEEKNKIIFRVLINSSVQVEMAILLWFV